MKITWDNIDDFKLSKKGNFRCKQCAVVLREGDDCCIICGDPYFTYKGDIKRGKGLICSNKCSGIYKSKQRDKPEPNTTCYWCNKPLYIKPSRLKKYNKHFCNHDHHVESQKVNHGCERKDESKYVKDGRYMGVCIYCGGKTDNLFCNGDCQTKYNYLIYINKWKLGLVDGTKGKYGISDNIRRYLFEKYNNSCQKCRWSVIHPVTGKIPLTIHHKDGDCTNNDECNLELLCPNCHCLTDNYGGLNKNNKITRDERLNNI